MIPKPLIKYFIFEILNQLNDFGGKAYLIDLLDAITRYNSSSIIKKFSTKSYQQTKSEKAINLAFFCLHNTKHIEISEGVCSITNKRIIFLLFSDDEVYKIIDRAYPTENNENYLIPFLLSKNRNGDLNFRRTDSSKVARKGNFEYYSSASRSRDILFSRKSSDGLIKNLDSFSLAEPPKEESLNQKRFVNCRIFEKGSSTRLKKLEKNLIYRTDIFISPSSQKEDIQANKPVDESKLAQSDTGHEIQIVFCPLSSAQDKNQIITPEIKTIFLPKIGITNTANFEFNSGYFGNAFRARIMVMHQNRILQTLLLAARNLDSELELLQENLTSPFFYSSDSEKPIDLAILINDNLAGIQGITAISSGKASFSEPLGLDITIDTIKKLLSKTNLEIAQEEISLENSVLLKLLIQLAHQGVILMRELIRQIDPNLLQNAERIQIVEARTKSYLPIEYVYTSIAPRIDAKICPNAKKSLEEKGNQIHESCEFANNKGYVCPSAFWGFSKCIERHPSGISEEHSFSIPQPGNDKLNAFNAAILAVSKRVDDVDVTGASGVYTAIEKLVNANNVRLATSWDDWQKNINLKPEASLLVLLPHSDNSQDFANIPALEVHGNWLASSEFNSSYVLPNQDVGIGPIVLLIGCSTALTDIPYLNFAREFKASGASIVIGTLATIHGKHASKFVSTFLGNLKLKNNNSRPFDEILLDVKRDMLSKGDCLVLSLVAYGNSSWQIQT
ncbi:MAG: hypothetical protein K2V71_08830 [Methylotenera sp.]|nr:hypothetical protein [Methylotenera sp.]